MAPQAESTVALYEGKWAIFQRWCQDHQIIPLQTTAPQVADFLLFLFHERGLATSTIEGYRSAIAGALKHSTGVDFGQDPALSAVLHSFKRERPRARQLFPPWDLSVVLTALGSPPFEPVSQVPLQLLTWKTVFLVLLASGGRRGEIHALDSKRVFFGEHLAWARLCTVPDFVSKTQLRQSGPGSPPEFLIPALAPIVGRDLPVDRGMCPVRSLKAYLDATKGKREGKRLLFVSYKEGHSTDIHKNTISGWVRKLLRFIYDRADPEVAVLAGTSTHAI